MRGWLAITMIFGNVYYAWMACRVSYQTKRFGDVTALPYGINTPSAFGFIFSLMGPVYGVAASACTASYQPGADEQYGQCLVDAIHTSWKSGVVCNLVAGIITASVGALGPLIGRVTPVGVLLSSLATIGIAFLVLNQLMLSASDPLTGFAPLVLMFVGYLGQVPFWKLPTAGVICLVGLILGWATGTATAEKVSESFQYVKWTGIGTGFEAFDDWSPVATYFGLIFAYALQVAVGTLMNVYSAEMVGDKYPLRESMISDGFGTIIGAIFGTPFMTTVYIGHPAYKATGCTMGYSIMNCTIFFIVSVTGLFAFVNAAIPMVAIVPVVIFVGVMICEEAVRSLPKRQVPVFFFAIIPGICDWACQSGANFGTMQAAFFGVYAFSRASIFFAMILGSIVYFSINRDFAFACGWSVFASACAAIGLIHQEKVSLSNYMSPAGEYCVTREELQFHDNSTCPDGYAECFGDKAGSCGFKNTTKLQFAMSYLLLAGMFLILWACQKFSNGKLVPHVVPEEEEPARVFNGEKPTIADCDPSIITKKIRHGSDNVSSPTTSDQGSSPGQSVV
uniref:Xanthine/uracil/vitamin C permease n=1 Tax=Mucochytrium quahogii TaxID=96639 RepID=A0A7S2RAH5_9STRA|mmetsp:Transcript_11475/g.24884  ORF Transcript_11475/g.24884 Transcript_11475/m.24884 type:complete len:564 (+) Transcript_11475:738-2429(+)